MKTVTKIVLAAGAVGLVSAAGVTGVAVTDSHASMHGKKHHASGKGRHHGHRGHGFERLMERFDTDKDRKLTQSELDDARKALLAKYDTNKDGKLSLQEFEPLWLEVMMRRMVRGFQRLDIDGDAGVTEEEFLRPFKNTVEKMDRNDDGVLDKQDRGRNRHQRGSGRQ